MYSKLHFSAIFFTYYYLKKKKKKKHSYAVTKPGNVGCSQTQADTSSWTSTVKLDVSYRIRQILLIMPKILLFLCQEINL